MVYSCCSYAQRPSEFVMRIIYGICSFIAGGNACIHAFTHLCIATRGHVSHHNRLSDLAVIAGCAASTEGKAG